MSKSRTRTKIKASSWHPTTSDTASKSTIQTRPFPALHQKAKTNQHLLNSPGLKPGAIIDNINRSMDNGHFPPESTMDLSALQGKLTIGEPGDKYEQEADEVAAQVVQRINAREIPPESPLETIQRKSAIPILGGVQRESVEEMRRKEVQNWIEGSSEFSRRIQRQIIEGSKPNIQADFEQNLNRAKGGGSPLDKAFRAKVEPAMGADFSDVKVHSDLEADNLSKAIQAKAFTTGKDIFFRQGEYEPGSRGGQELLAHELTHVVQQGNVAQSKLKSKSESREVHSNFHKQIGVTADRECNSIRLAHFNVGSVTVNVDYGNLTSILPTNYQTAIETRFTSWTGSPASTIHSAVAGLSGDQQKWVLYGLDVLVDNTTSSLSGLNRSQAVELLIAHSPSSSTLPFGGGFDFEREVLRVSGWFEVALSANLITPTGTTQSNLTQIYNPPSSSSTPSSGTLDVAALQSQLPPALTSLLTGMDPQGWTSRGTRSLSDLQTIADLIQAEARSFFSPYADVAKSNAYSQAWQYSANLFIVTAIPSTSISPNLRIGYLLNRAEIAGRQRQTRGNSIFSNVNFDSSRPADQAALLSIVTSMEANTTIQGIVNRLIQHTGRTTGALTSRRVGISTEYKAVAQTACQARWRAIDTLCHELVHVLVNPAFPARASSVRFGQIIREGFTEVLGVQLYNDRIRTKALSDINFRRQMEMGISGTCSIPNATIDYGQAGTSAESIRQLVGDDNFRAAYFLGSTNLVGL